MFICVTICTTLSVQMWVKCKRCYSSSALYTFICARGSRRAAVNPVNAHPWLTPWSTPSVHRYNDRVRDRAIMQNDTRTRYITRFNRSEIAYSQDVVRGRGRFLFPVYSNNTVGPLAGVISAEREENGAEPPRANAHCLQSVIFFFFFFARGEKVDERPPRTD